MKSYYCFIRDYGRMYPGHFVYHVSCGISQREQSKLALVQTYCKDCGIFFKKWSSQVDDALDLAAKPFRPCRNYSGKPFIHAYISISDLYNLIVDDSFIKYESNYLPSLSELHCSFRNLPAFISSMNQKIRNTACPPHRRKYLSPAYRDLNLGGAMAFGFVLLMILADFICKQITLIF